MNRREFLNDKDVISVDDNEKISINNKTFTVKEFLSSIYAEYFACDISHKWFFETVECEILSPGKTWRKGKIKISLEFIPDKNESPLDEIRQEMQSDPQ